MTYFQSIILGLVQGAAEFLPISSSGHLVLAQSLLGLEGDFLSFDIMLHLGTLVAVFCIFWKDFVALITAFFKMLWDLVTSFKLNLKKSPYRKLVIMLILATIPLVVGAVLEKYIGKLFNSTFFVGIALLITGTILIATSKLKEGTLGLEESNYKNALVVGFMQLVAVLPGISRSGSTIFGGILSGLNREFAVKFSFLLSSIAILGATAVDLLKRDATSIAVAPTVSLAGMLTAFLVGLVAIKWLIKLISNKKYTGMAIYCYLVGLWAIFFIR